METIQQQLNALQTSVKRQRLLNIALIGVIIVGSSVAATVAATSTRKAVQISMIDQISTAELGLGPSGKLNGIVIPFTISVIDDEGFVWVYKDLEWMAFPQLPVKRIEPPKPKPKPMIP